MALLLAGTAWQKDLFLRDDFSDCEILVVTPTSSHRFPCHRAILSLANEVFAKMFQSNFKECTTGKIVIKDTSPSIMLNILKYIYGGLLYIEDWRMACDILKFAHKYHMPKLWQECEKFLSRNMTLDNVCAILKFSSFYNLTELKEQCLRLFSKGFFALVRKKALIKLNLDLMKEILCRQDLNVENEMVVFKAVWDWGILECCKKERKVTDDNIIDEMKIFINCIGFEFMTNEELESLPSVVLEVWQQSKNKVALNEEECKMNGELDPCHEMSNKCNSSIVPQLLKKREIEFPVGLLRDSLTTFKMSLASLGASSTGSQLLRLSFTSYVYLHDVTIICYRNLSHDLPYGNDSSCNKTPSNTSNKTGSSFSAVLCYPAQPSSAFICASKSTDTSSDFYEPHHLSLRVTSKDKTMEVTCKKIVSSLICQKLITHQGSSKVSKEIYKIKFEAASLLLLDAGVEYSLEVGKVLESAHSMPKYTLTWPAVLLKCRMPKKMQLRLHSWECYGLSKLRVIDAS